MIRATTWIIINLSISAAGKLSDQLEKQCAVSTRRDNFVIKDKQNYC